MKQLMEPHTPLTQKQRLFVAEYLVDLNQKEAAIRAGYSPRTADAQASSLLKKFSWDDFIPEVRP